MNGAVIIRAINTNLYQHVWTTMIITLMHIIDAKASLYCYPRVLYDYHFDIYKYI